MSERDVLYYYQPSARQIRLWCPKTKEEIIRCYERNSQILELRRFKDVYVKVEYYQEIVDAHTKEVISRGEPEIRRHLCWKLAEQDYQWYKKNLESWYKQKKKEYNQKLRAEKAKLEAQELNES
jgi:hypothetical protein